MLIGPQTFVAHHLLPTFKALIVTSIAMVNSTTIVVWHYGGEIWCGEAELQVFELGMTHIYDGLWYFEEVKSSP